MKNKWNYRYIDLARHISTWSKDPSSKIGAVVIGDYGQVLSTGYNGFPRNIEDSEERLNNRETKLGLVVHAEMNCIYNASLTGTSLKGASLYCYGLPICSDCAKGIIQAGISEVYVRKIDINKSERWKESWIKSKLMFEESV